jgi:hypothetical protein
MGNGGKMEGERKEAGGRSPYDTYLPRSVSTEKNKRSEEKEKKLGSR